MEDNIIFAKDAVKELGLYLKLVVSTKSFENYNSFFNIYDEFEEPCRRIAVITPYLELEEVIDANSDKPIEKYSIIDGNMWLGEYPLLCSPSKIKLEEIVLTSEAYNKCLKLRR